jgi:hypothetical protein
MSSTAKVELECALFRRMPGGYFRLSSQTQEPVYVVSHGGAEFALPFRGIRKEFAIAEGSPDDRMLERIAEALQFVSALRPGDEFPPEMIDRKASWEPAEQDRRYALAMVKYSLVNWHRRTPTPDPVEPLAMIALMDGADMRKAASEAIEALAADERLGLRDVRAAQRKVQDLADEISYCEYIFRKLRDGFSVMDEKLRSVAGQFRRDQSVFDQANRCVTLLAKGKASLLEDAASTAANYGEAYASLMNFDNTIMFVRNARDRHYKIFRVWDDLFHKWQRISVTEDRTILTLIEETYRFLAPRYAPIQEWVSFLTNPGTKKSGLNVVEW